MNGVLAYPHFFPPPDWLKLAALCWDKIYTLRETGAARPDYIEEFEANVPEVLDRIEVAEFSADPAVREQFEHWLAAHGHDQASSMAPIASRQSQYIMIDGLVGPDDREWFQESLRKNGLLSRSKKAPHRVPRWEFEPRLLYPEGPAGPDPHAETRFRFYEAVASGDHRLAKKLLKKDLPNDMHSRLQRLLRPADVSPDEFAGDVVFLPPEVPFHFLALCAARAAGARGLDLATDNNAFVGTCHYDRGQVAADVGLRLIQAVVPADGSALDMSQIADLRREFSTRRLQYQREVQGLCDEFTQLFSEQSLRTAAKRIEELARARVEESQQIYRRAKAEVVLRTFGVAIAPPAIMTSIASMVGIGLFAPATIAAGLATVIGLTLVEGKKIEMNKEKAAWSYILDLRGRLRKPWWRLWG
jgi:hypothetical protein